MRALDLFAGTGWGVACQELGIEEFGVDNAPSVIATRAANGMGTLFEDVWHGLHDEGLVPAHDIEIASPPCQTFTLAGNGAGRRALGDVLRLIAERAYFRVDEMRAFAAEHGDDRTALVLAPLAYAARFRPRFVVFEQVPPVLPVWDACADELRAMGYSVWAGNLHAEQYGVPQTRKRAVLIARRDGAEAVPPTPTHSRYYPSDPGRLDPGVLPWVNMADALGWETGELVLRSNYGSGGDPAARGERTLAQPSPTVTSKIDRNQWRFAAAGRTEPNAQRQRTRGQDQPAATVTGSRSASWVTHELMRNVSVEEAARLQTYPVGFEWVGTRTASFQQIGNAVPPLLAQRVLEAAIA